MVRLDISVEGSYPDGLLLWVVSGNRQTKNYSVAANRVTVDVVVGLVSITVYDQRNYTNVGTTVISVTASTSSEASTVQRRLARRPNITNRALVTITCTVPAPYALSKPKLPTPPSQCTERLTDVAWPVDVCIGHGNPNLRPTLVNDDDCKTLATRWASYVRFAAMLGSASTTKTNNYTTFAVALGMVGGCYHLEDEDDRGVAGLTLCRHDDCDGMAMSSVAFWNMVVANHAAIKKHLKDPAALQLLSWATQRYPTAFVAFGLSANPKPPHKQFYHAWALCEARPPSMYKAYELLTATEQEALATLKMSPSAWKEGKHFSCRGTAWSTLSKAECSALTALGWNKEMWSATAKVHIESTSALSFDPAGTTPSKTITEKQAQYRQMPEFSKSKRKLLFSGIRRKPRDLDLYINLKSVQGAHFACTFDHPLSYPEWIKSDDMYPRCAPQCCDASCMDQRARLAPVIMRSKEEAAHLERPPNAIGAMPASLGAGAEYVITDWDYKHPPKATETWSPLPIVLDWCNSWVLWTKRENRFVDSTMSACSMGS